MTPGHDEGDGRNFCRGEELAERRVEHSQRVDRQDRTVGGEKGQHQQGTAQIGEDQHPALAEAVNERSGRRAEEQGGDREAGDDQTDTRTGVGQALDFDDQTVVERVLGGLRTDLRHPEQEERSLAQHRAVAVSLRPARLRWLGRLVVQRRGQRRF